MVIPAPRPGPVVRHAAYTLAIWLCGNARTNAAGRRLTDLLHALDIVTRRFGR